MVQAVAARSSNAAGVTYNRSANSNKIGSRPVQAKTDRAVKSAKRLQPDKFNRLVSGLANRLDRRYRASDRPVAVKEEAVVRRPTAEATANKILF